MPLEQFQQKQHGRYDQTSTPDPLVDRIDGSDEVPLRDITVVESGFLPGGQLDVYEVRGVSSGHERRGRDAAYVTRRLESGAGAIQQIPPLTLRVRLAVEPADQPAESFVVVGNAVDDQMRFVDQLSNRAPDRRCRVGLPFVPAIDLFDAAAREGPVTAKKAKFRRAFDEQDFGVIRVAASHDDGSGVVSLRHGKSWGLTRILPRARAGPALCWIWRVDETADADERIAGAIGGGSIAMPFGSAGSGSIPA